MSQSLKETILVTAAYYQQTLPDAVLRMYCEDLSDLPAADVISAYTAYRKNPKNKKMPIPAEIRAIVRPEENRDYRVQLTADRIFTAIQSHGEDWANGYESVFSPTGKYFFAQKNGKRESFHSFEDAFLSEVGEDALRVLQSKNLSWAGLCREYISYQNPSTFKAHLRASVERALESPIKNQVLLDQINSILKIETRKVSQNIPVYALPEAGGDSNEGA